MLGFYAYVIQKASQAILYSATDRQARTSARLLSLAAVNFAVRQITYANSEKYDVSNLSVSGGSVSWRVTALDLSAGTSSVTGIGMFGPDTVTQYASLVRISAPLVHDRWSITSVYASTPQLKDMPYYITR